MIKLENPTGRNTQAHIVTIGDREYFFSYQTCIAYRGPFPSDVGWGGEDTPTGGGAVRIDNYWGPTTGRHFNDLGCKHFPIIKREIFEHIVEGSL